MMLAVVLLLCLALSSAFQLSGLGARKWTTGAGTLHMSARPIHTGFQVTKATDAQMEEMKVKSWPTWSTQGTKYKTGEMSPDKVYDCNELSYIIKGSMEITPKGGEPVLVQAGDFITFPDGFACNWFVKETILKHYYIY
mmetsp:Transcript_31734/g.69910  ORF Transcript_31734/g.69910 Transcript_31734/m.69910 type:complete len:139 (-) Transcript_31734:152-568(-)